MDQVRVVSKRFDSRQPVEGGSNARRGTSLVLAAGADQYRHFYLVGKDIGIKVVKGIEAVLVGSTKYKEDIIAG